MGNEGAFYLVVFFLSTSPDSKMTSPLSSDSGRGADYSGPAATTFTSLPEVTELGTSAQNKNRLAAILVRKVKLTWSA